MSWRSCLLPGRRPSGSRKIRPSAGRAAAARQGAGYVFTTLATATSYPDRFGKIVKRVPSCARRTSKSRRSTVRIRRVPSRSATATTEASLRPMSSLRYLSRSTEHRSISVRSSGSSGKRPVDKASKKSNSACRPRRVRNRKSISAKHATGTWIVSRSVRTTFRTAPWYASSASYNA